VNVALVAHRCGTDKYPELTIAAARHSLEIGAAYVEMDIRFTKDNVPVISHDQDALRLYGSTVKICDMLSVDFLKLRHTSNRDYSTHSLEEIVNNGVAPILFHIKEGGERLKQILHRLRTANYEDKVTMGVTAVEDIGIVKAFNSNISVLAFMPAKEHSQAFIDAGADSIRLWEEWVTQEDVQRIKATGRKLWVMAGTAMEGSVGYTSDDNLKFWQEIGVDGILVNEIEKAKSLLYGR